MKQKGGNTTVEAADPNKSNFKRDVSAIMEDLSKKLDKEKPVNEHFCSVLSKSEIGTNSSLSQHLCYRCNIKTSLSLADHSYVNFPLFNKNCITIEEGKSEKIQKYVDNDYVSSEVTKPITEIVDT